MTGRSIQMEGGNHDRLLVTLFLAAVAHAILILGVSFSLPKSDPVEKSLDIVLVQSPTKKPPDKADFLAPDNQLGSGKAKKKTVPKSAPPVLQGEGDALVTPAPESRPTNLARSKPRLTQAQSPKKIMASTGEEEPKAEEERPRLTRDAIRQQISEITTELSPSPELEAKEPRVVEINAVSTHKHIAAEYEKSWQDKVERIGTLNFPAEAQRKKISGSLTLSVSLRQDGTVETIKVKQSSGSQVLDESAKQIVNLAAPYSAFPEELKRQADILVITRTWRFTVGKSVETSQQ